jgi:hypothetical protein
LYLAETSLFFLHSIFTDYSREEENGTIFQKTANNTTFFKEEDALDDFSEPDPGNEFYDPAGAYYNCSCIFKRLFALQELYADVGGFA